MLTERIRTLRKALKLSQAEFGKILGTTRDVIGNLEYGRSTPKPSFLDLICTIFNVNSDWLLNGTGEMFKPVPQTDEELEEATRIFDKLSPTLRKYALQQIKGLLEVQNTTDKSDNHE